MIPMEPPREDDEGEGVTVVVGGEDKVEEERTVGVPGKVYANHEMME